MARCFIIVRSTGSLFPNSWEVTPESSDWYSVFPQGRETPNLYLHAKKMAERNGNAALFVFTPSAALADRLETFASASSKAWTLAELKADNGALATTIKTYWTDRDELNVIDINSSMFGWDYKGMKND
jgi:hypothetical protein